MVKKTKRNLFNELKQGIQEIEEHRQGKITLRSHSFEKKPRLEIDADRNNPKLIFPGSDNS